MLFDAPFSVVIADIARLQILVLLLLARDAFLRTNRPAIAMMFVRPSVCLGRACIVIIRCTLARL